MDESKQDYEMLHLDLVNAILNLQVAEKHLRIAEAYISQTSTTALRQIQLDTVARTAMGTGIALILPMVAHTINVGEVAKAPCERRYPNLSSDPLRVV